MARRAETKRLNGDSKEKMTVKRINLENQIYFVTAKIFNNKKIFREDKICQLFINILKECKLKYRFKLYGYVIMPDHIHLLIEPDQGFTISQVIQKVKGRFANKLKQELHNRVAESFTLGGDGDSKTVAYADLIKKGRSVWQKSFYDHAIRNEKDFIEKLNYIHKNPLKLNIEASLDEYRWSSFRITS